jgi:hypothetical protein
MKRAPRRLRLFALAAGIPVLTLAPWAYAATAAPEFPTITFTSTGTAPIVCGTRPNVTNLLIRHGTRIIIANRTGVSTTIDVGRRRVLEVPDGSGVRVRLSRGQHELRMIPDCVVAGEAEMAVVNVLTWEQMRDLASPEATPTPKSDGGGSGVTVEATTDPGSPPGPAESGVVASPAPTADPAGPTSDEDANTVVESSDDPPDPLILGAQQAPAGTEIVEIEAFQLDDRGDPKGLRLLAAIATICVLGVTAAIIRAIVAERTSDPVG